ncbi:hypothetical protein [Streptomyces capuensis]|uniref:hypothetical protein n=1 Tax=Streptomyces capuensis TaxID=1464056 RepID=UPI0004C1E9F0|nr:hypothetical protein [Streptomyces capuensis]
MRLQRFQDLTLTLAAKDPNAGQPTSLKDAGDSKHPFGLAVTLAGRPARIQFTVKSAPSDNYDKPEQPVEGDPAPLDGPRAEGPEGWLAGLLAASGNREIAGIEQWSLREDPKDRRDGLTVQFHSGAEVYARVL